MVLSTVSVLFLPSIPQNETGLTTRSLAYVLGPLLHYPQIAYSIENGTHPLMRVRQEHLQKEKVERLKRARSLIYNELASQARFEVESAKRIWQLAVELYPDDVPKQGCRRSEAVTKCKVATIVVLLPLRIFFLEPFHFSLPLNTC